MPSGGPRQPTNPAPTSGPGALSQRTDGTQPTMDMPNAAYGENKEFRQAQQGAPMPQQQQGAAPDDSQQGSPVDVMPMNAPSARPEQPVTAGIDSGAGPGSSALGLLNEGQVDREDAQALMSYLPVLEELANRPESAPSTRVAVRRIKAALRV